MLIYYQLIVIAATNYDLLTTSSEHLSHENRISLPGMLFCNPISSWMK